MFKEILVRICIYYMYIVRRQQPMSCLMLCLSIFMLCLSMATTCCSHILICIVLYIVYLLYSIRRPSVCPSPHLFLVLLLPSSSECFEVSNTNNHTNVILHYTTLISRILYTNIALHCISTKQLVSQHLILTN